MTNPPTPYRQLTATEYLYRGHYIAQVAGWWLVTDQRVAGCEMFRGDSVDDCIAAIDAVLDDN